MKQYFNWFTDGNGCISKNRDKAVSKIYYVFEDYFAPATYHHLSTLGGFQIYNRCGMSSHPKFVIIKKITNENT